MDAFFVGCFCNSNFHFSKENVLKIHILVKSGQKSTWHWRGPWEACTGGGHPPSLPASGNQKYSDV